MSCTAPTGGPVGIGPVARGKGQREEPGAPRPLQAVTRGTVVGHRCDAGRTSKRLKVRIEGSQLDDAGPNLEDAERTFLSVGSSDDLGQSVTGHVAGSDVHSVAKRGIWSGGGDVANGEVIREEARELRQATAARDPKTTHVRAAAGSCPGDDLRPAVTVHVRGGDADEALEGGEVGKKAGELGDAGPVPRL